MKSWDALYAMFESPKSVLGGLCYVYARLGKINISMFLITYFNL